MKRNAMGLMLTLAMTAGLIAGCSGNVANTMLKKSSEGENAAAEDVQVVTVWSDNAH